jgi:hypothetical protein
LFLPVVSLSMTSTNRSETSFTALSVFIVGSIVAENC